MRLIPNRRSSLKSSQNQVNMSDTDLQLQSYHHRHQLDYDYIPPGNEDMNSPELFPHIPEAVTLQADRVYSDPYRQNTFIVDKNCKQVQFTDAEAAEKLNRRRKIISGRSKELS